MIDFNEMFDMKNDKQPKDFGELVSMTLDQVTEVQAMLSGVEKGLLAMKADNTCDNNIPLMIAAMEFADNGPRLLKNISTVAEAHVMEKHGDSIQMIDGDDLPPEIRDALTSVIKHMMGRKMGRKGRRDFDGRFN